MKVLHIINALNRGGTETFLCRLILNDEINQHEVISLKNNDNDNLDGVEQELRLKIPSIDKSDLKLNQTGEELIIEVGRYRRNMLLPRSLQKREVLSASMNNDILKVKFGGQNNE